VTAVFTGLTRIRNCEWVHWMSTKEQKNNRYYGHFHYSFTFICRMQSRIHARCYEAIEELSNDISTVYNHNCHSLLHWRKNFKVIYFSNSYINVFSLRYTVISVKCRLAVKIRVRSSILSFSDWTWWKLLLRVRRWTQNRFFFKMQDIRSLALYWLPKSALTNVKVS
jgi:hypothetical protein